MPGPKHIRTVYLALVGGNTLAASLIWGINTIFLLDAGLSNFEAFLANAFFTLGQVIFEVPTGIVADTFGRRTSYLLGAFTLGASTALYLLMWQIHGPFWGWAASSMLLGLGFTFFSGALEAWLVDALRATGFKGGLEGVFAKGQMIGGAAMLFGSIAGGLIAQFTNLGVPYILRSLILIFNFATAFFFMRDLGFTPKSMDHPWQEIKGVLQSSVKHGLKNPSVRWVMLAAPFTVGTSFYIFYALQPFLLELYGSKTAYGIAGLVAAIGALAQIAGGYAAPAIKRYWKQRTSALIAGTIVAAIVVALTAFTGNFWIALALIFVWGLVFAAMTPVRQAYINDHIPGEQRATVLSFDALMGSSGGIVTQPVLGKVADLWSYPASYVAASLIQLGALPFLMKARKEEIGSQSQGAV